LVKVGSSFGDRKVCILGLGYVGLTLAAVMADVGFSVTGVEIRPEVLEFLREGKASFHEPGLEKMLHQGAEDGLLSWQQYIPDGCDATVYIITVGTPLDQNGKVRLDMIERVAREIAAKAKPGSLLIMRSTVMIGTTSRMIMPILEEAGKNLSVAFCPERTVEGQALRELRQLPQIVGAVDPETVMRASQIFQFLTPTVVRVGSYEAAEMIKLVDNSQRDMMFGFANEIAAMCDAIGISADEVIRSGRLGYARHAVPLPGPVGGPCLSKDPYILEQSMARFGARPAITVTARKTNERQLTDIAQVLRNWTDGLKGFPRKPVISLLGLAFKGRPATDDLRGTTATPIFEALKAAYPDAEFRGFDAVATPEQIRKFGVAPVTRIEDAFEGASLALILNNHPIFEVLALPQLARSMTRPGIIYDLWHHFDASELRLPAGVGYAALGSHGLAKLPIPAG
jgi:UDP-N-acetyl-D-mannosaminuronic acid dehydrogenase